jgi:hypothetical protein
MPVGPFLSSLSEKAPGRVLGGNSDFPHNSAKPEQLTDKDFEALQQNTNVQEQFIDCFFVVIAKCV